MRVGADREQRRRWIELARTAADIDRIHARGKMAAVLDIEGSFDLDGDPAVIRRMYALGLRSVQLSAHNWTSNYADSCCSRTQVARVERPRTRGDPRDEPAGHADQRVACLRRSDLAGDRYRAPCRWWRRTTACARSTIFRATCRKPARRSSPARVASSDSRSAANFIAARRSSGAPAARGGKPFWDTSAIVERGTQAEYLRNRPTGRAAVPDGAGRDSARRSDQRR